MRLMTCGHTTVLPFVGALAAVTIGSLSCSHGNGAPGPTNDGGADAQDAQDAREGKPANWVRTFPGDLQDYTHGLVVTGDRSVVVTGRSAGHLDVPNGAGFDGPAAFAAAFSRDGSHQWTWHMTADLAESVSLTAARLGSGVLLVGDFAGRVTLPLSQGTVSMSPEGVADVFALAIDAGGAPGQPFTIGGAFAYVSSNAAVAAPDGSVIVAGKLTGGPVDFDPGSGVRELTGSSDVFVIRLGAQQQLVWARLIEGSGSARVSRVAVAGDGRIALVGSFDGSLDLDPGAGQEVRTSKGWEDAFVDVLSPAGDYLWGATVGGAGSDVGAAVAFSEQGTLFAAGSFDEELTSREAGRDIVHRSQGSFDTFVMALNESGSTLWFRTFGGLGGDIPWATAVLSDGSLAVAGGFMRTVTLVGREHIALGTSRNAFLVRIAQDGQMTQALSFGGDGDDFAWHLAPDPDGGLAVSGVFSGQADFGLWGVPDVRRSAGGSDVFVIRFADDLWK